MRFWGWRENEREQKLDMAEMTERARKGLPLYGVSADTPYLQGVAMRNSQFSQLMFRKHYEPVVKPLALQLCYRRSSLVCCAFTSLLGLNLLGSIFHAILITA